MNTHPSSDKEILSTKALEHIATLSQAEYAIFKLVGQGLKTAEISKARGGAHLKTLESQKNSIKYKLGLPNMERVIALASRYNLFRAHHPEVLRKQIPAHNLYQSTAVINNSTILK